MSIKKFLPAFLLLLIFPGQASNAQTVEEATALFSTGKYSEAKTAFDAILKKTPNNVPAYFYYGAACYELNDWQSAEKFLKIAASKRNTEAQRYLGELYFLTYRFDESIAAYKAYVDANKKNESIGNKFNKKIEKATLGKSMLNRVEDVKIIDSLIVDKTNFFSHYKLSKSTGKLISADDFFKNGGESSDATLYQTEKGNRIIYSKQTESGRLDIFMQDKLFEGYGNEKNLGENINSSFNENYPFQLNDGITLYFASTAESSLGGYDIFVTRYNSDSDSYLMPENIGMPFNSPFNDYMMVIDEVNNVGWFVSDRYQPDGKVIIYVFIPNEGKKILRDEDTGYLINRARITGIAKTWEENDDFTKLLEKIYNINSTQQTDDEFRFVVADDLIYTKLDNFKSNAARNLFVQAQKAEDNYNKLSAHLEKLRVEYASSSASKKQQLSSEILQLEKEEIRLQPEINAAYSKVRDEEVRFIMKK